jgi:predicted GH43/DUF377 family glycosyl hydrolase
MISCFPRLLGIHSSAMIRHGDTFRVYYGAADTSTVVVEFAKKDIPAALR